MYQSFVATGRSETSAVTYLLIALYLVLVAAVIGVMLAAGISPFASSGPSRVQPSSQIQSII